jgi:Phosphotransferase enzyme family
MPDSPRPPAAPPARLWHDDPDHPQPEIPLLGGDVTEGVVRVGNTVRRAPGRGADYVHALLDHLEAKGFQGAPRFLGVDASGREVLTFVEGEVAGRPHPIWVADERRLASLGRFLRAYDDAAQDFVPPPGIEPDPGPPELPGLPPAPKAEPDIVAHLDITPENIVFRDGEAYALIDFDLARPSTRVDELYSVMLWWAPLNEPADVAPALATVDPFRRSRILADAYGMSAQDRARLVEVATLRTRRSWHTMKLRAELEGGGWQRMWDEGVGDIIKRREAWLDRNAPNLNAALTAP